MRVSRRRVSFSRLLACLGGLHHTDEPPRPPRPQPSWRQTPYCMSTSMRNLNNGPCHRHKSQPLSSAGPSSAHSNFISPRRKIEAGGINSRYIPNISPAIWAAPAGAMLHILNRGGGANNLLAVYYIRPQRRAELAAAESDKNKANRNSSISR